jgi:hypothetical protein
MILLTGTSDIIRIVTEAGAIDSHASWVDLSAGVMTPSRTNTTQITTATTTPIVGSPAGSTQRSLKYLSIRNSHATTSNLVSVQHYDGTNSEVLFKCNLLAGEKIDFIDGHGWVYYAADGSKKATQAAYGSTSQVQYNNGGVLGASSNFTYTVGTNTMGLSGTDPLIKLGGITTEPGMQSSGILAVYAKSVCGKMMLKQVGPSGLDTPLQNAIWQNNTVLYTPAAAAGVWQGTVGTNMGTPTIGLPTTTNVGTMLRRSQFPSVVTTANQQVGTRTEAMFFRGNAAGIGGFMMATRFMLAKWTTGDRLFIGFTSGTTAVVTVDPSSLTNMLGFGVDAADTAISFMHNDASLTCTKDPISGQPSLATNNAYAAYIFCKPNDSTVYYRLDNLTTGTVLIDSSTSTDLPVNTTALTCQAIIGNAANIVAGDANIGVNRIYIETDI